MAESGESPGQSQLPPVEPQKAPETPQFDERHYRNVIGALNTAFDVQSTGMGVMTQALDAFAKGQELTRWQKIALADGKSNYFNHQYVQLWLKDKNQLTPTEKLLFPKLGPRNITPLTNRHVAVYNSSQQEYKELTEIIIRQALLDDANLEVLYKSYAPMTLDEFRSLRESAAKRGVIEIFDPAEPFTTIPRSIGVLIQGGEHGMRIPDDLSQYIIDLPFLGLLEAKTKRAAALKLGAMLGLTEQLTYDAHTAGRPIPTEYVPDDPHTAEHWNTQLGKPIPPIGDLYGDAHNVLRDVTSTDDPITGYLHTIHALPHLVP